MPATSQLLWRAVTVGPNVVALLGLALIGAGKFWHYAAMVRVGLYALVPAAVVGGVGLLFALGVFSSRVVLLYRSNAAARPGSARPANSGSDPNERVP